MFFPETGKSFPGRVGKGNPHNVDWMCSSFRLFSSVWAYLPLWGTDLLRKSYQPILSWSLKGFKATRENVTTTFESIAKSGTTMGHSLQSLNPIYFFTARPNVRHNFLAFLSVFTMILLSPALSWNNGTGVLHWVQQESREIPGPCSGVLGEDRNNTWIFYYCF